MKALKLLTVSYLALPTTAFSLSSLVSKSHQAALAGVTAAQKAMSEANVSAAMAAAAKRTRDFAAESVPEATLLAYKACKTNPGTTVACGTAGVGLLMVAAPAILAAPSLAAAGFGAHGVVLGSTAASIQSGIGSVVAPGLFATLQSAGAGGYGVATVYGTVQVAGGAIASSAVGVLAWSKAKL